MSRFSLFAVAAALILATLPVGFAQEVPEEPTTPLRVTPIVLEYATQTRLTAEQMERPDEKVAALFQLLSLEIRFEDKTSARRTVQTIAGLVPSIPRESTRSQVLETVAFSLVEIGDFKEAFATLDRIAEAAKLAEARLNTAEKIINDTRDGLIKEKIDVTDLMEKAIAGAAETKDVGLETLGSVLLAREYDKQGKTDPARALMLQARNRARELDEVEESNLVLLIAQSHVEAGRTEDALALASTTTDPAFKENIQALIAVTLAKGEKADEAEKILRNMPAGNSRDDAVIGCLTAEIKTVSVEKLDTLARWMSSPQRLEQFYSIACQFLLENGRTDEARTVAEKGGFGRIIGDVVNMETLKSLVEKKEFAEAGKIVETFADEAVKNDARRFLLISQMQAEGLDTVLDRIPDILSAEEKEIATTIRTEFDEAAKIEDFNTRMGAFLELLQRQLEIFDLAGAQAILRAVMDSASAADDPLKIIPTRLATSRIQAQISDRNGAKSNLDALRKYLDGVKDPMILKDLVPNEPVSAEMESPLNPEQPTLKLRGPVDETAVKEQLFGIYASIADILAQVEAWSDAESAWKKASDLASEDANVRRRLDKQVLLARMIAEFENAKSTDAGPETVKP